MSLWRWLDGASPPPVKKAKTPDEKKAAQIQYENTKRERTFQPTWQQTFKWLAFDNNKMYCRVCQQYNVSDEGSFVRGTSNFRIDPIRKHEASDSHHKCVLKDKAAAFMPGTSRAEKTIVMMNKAAVGKLTILFRNAHFVAKSRRPFTDFVKLCALDVAKGTQLGNTYRTDKYCQTFIAAIADNRRNEQKAHVEATPFISIISDGATDCASKETEIVYLRSSLKCEVCPILCCK